MEAAQVTAAAVTHPRGAVATRDNHLVTEGTSVFGALFAEASEVPNENPAHHLAAWAPVTSGPAAAPSADGAVEEPVAMDIGGDAERLLDWDRQTPGTSIDEPLPTIPIASSQSEKRASKQAGQALPTGPIKLAGEAETSAKPLAELVPDTAAIAEKSRGNAASVPGHPARGVPDPQTTAHPEKPLRTDLVMDSTGGKVPSNSDPHPSPLPRLVPQSAGVHDTDRGISQAAMVKTKTDAGFLTEPQVKHGDNVPAENARIREISMAPTGQPEKPLTAVASAERQVQRYHDGGSAHEAPPVDTVRADGEGDAEPSSAPLSFAASPIDHRQAFVAGPPGNAHRPQPAGKGDAALPGAVLTAAIPDPRAPTESVVPLPENLRQPLSAKIDPKSAELAPAAPRPLQASAPAETVADMRHSASGDVGKGVATKPAPFLPIPNASGKVPIAVAAISRDDATRPVANGQPAELAPLPGLAPQPTIGLVAVSASSAAPPGIAIAPLLSSSDHPIDNEPSKYLVPGSQTGNPKEAKTAAIEFLVQNRNSNRMMVAAPIPVRPEIPLPLPPNASGPGTVMTPPDAGGQGSIIVAPVIEYSVAPELLAQDLIPAERMDGVVANEVEGKDLIVERAAALADPKTPRQIGLQLAEAARRLPSGPVEVSLNPEELGRVKMVLTAGDGAITVSLSVERPETADLMRRNLANLGAEFRDLGYSDVRFSFSGDGDRGRPDLASPGMAAETGHAEAAPPGAADAPRQTAAATGRLDIRI